MAQTATALLTVLKERWTSDELQRQFLSDDSPLSKLEQRTGVMIGKQAQTPVLLTGNSGYTSVGASGGTLNPAGQQGVNQAQWTLVNHWLQIAIDAAAINQSGSNEQAIVAAKDLEIEGGVIDMRRQMTRQLVTNGDSIVAQCATSGGSTVVPLVASPSGTAWGFDALMRSWLQTTMNVDIGTIADTDSLVTASPISAVAINATAPTITIGTSITTTAGTHFVYIPNPNSATAPNPEMNGLRNIVSTTGALGGLNPATGGQELWQAASRDTATTVLSLDLLLSLQQQVMQFSGKKHTENWTGLKQQKNFYALLENQVRYSRDDGLNAGSVDTVKWGNMSIDAFPAILDSDWYCLTLSDVFRVTGSQTKPTWASDVQGSNTGALWAQGTTQFVDGVSYPMNIGVQRRNTHAAATGLTA